MTCYPSCLIRQCNDHQVVRANTVNSRKPSARTSYYPVEIVNPRDAAWRDAVGLTNTPFCGQTKGPGQQQQPSALRPAFNLPQHTNGSLEMLVWLSGLEKWHLIGSRVYLGNVNVFVTSTRSPTNTNEVLLESFGFIIFKTSRRILSFVIFFFNYLIGINK